MRFTDRGDAGRQLADRVGFLRLPRPVVAAVPPGGVPVAFEVAQRLGAPLDVVGVRTLGAPLQPGVIVGAVGECRVVVLNQRLVKQLSIAKSWLNAEANRATAAMTGQVGRLRNGLPSPPVLGRVVVLVDDGTANALTVHAAVDVLRRRGAARVVLASPVVAVNALPALRRHVEDVARLEQVSTRQAVGRGYRDFRPVSDNKVRRLLSVAAGLQPDLACEIAVRDGDEGPLMGNLAVPVGAMGLIIFAHGPSDGRRSPERRTLATRLGEAGLGTLLVDLLTEREATRPRAARDVRLLADRLITVTRWVAKRPELGHLPIGYFGVGTGVAAAFVAAAETKLADAIVSCGGYPDPATGWLPQVATPTLLIIGTRDTAIRAANIRAQCALRGVAELETVPGATYPIGGPATRQRVGDLAATWFVDYLRPLTAAAG
ncbi:MAG: phosphoribosyltransferase [Actinophytocola sp.]|uniref:phosphoribosyltransferase family protein n=1 Tax=Actinophytocola sp. TaxID=1872138 RepID=UPI001325578D|nr:phosphoribosyltransferase family protein [Actinophytocola sp.]MPZ78996.1 phosphoribosyltransferase [Actinophytocola sp.]